MVWDSSEDKHMTDKVGCKFQIYLVLILWQLQFFKNEEKLSVSLSEKGNKLGTPIARIIYCRSFESVRRLSLFYGRKLEK